MVARAWPVLEAAVEAGVGYGWRRAHKHTDTPAEGAIIDKICQAVLCQIAEQFEFDDCSISRDPSGLPTVEKSCDGSCIGSQCRK